MIRIVLCLFFVCMRMNSACAMQLSDCASKKAPTTIYEYFGLSNRFAESGLNDIKKQLTREIMQGQDCWYVKTTLGESTAAPQKIAYSCDGALVAAVCSDKAFRIWDQDGKNKVTHHHQCALTGLVGSPTESLFYLSRDDNVLEKVDGDGNTLKRVFSEVSKVVAINAEGTEIATVVADAIKTYRSAYEPKIWSCKDLTIKQEVELINNVCAVEFYPRGHKWDFILAKSLEKTAELLRARHDAEEMRTHDSITCMAVDAQGERHLVGYPSGMVSLLDADLRTRWTYSHGDAPIKAIIFDAKEKHYFAALADRVYITAVQAPTDVNKRWARQRLMQRGVVQALALHNFGTHEQLAVACEDAPAAVWQHTALTFEQMLLQLILKEHLTRCIMERALPKCPTPEEQYSDETFITWMAHAFNLNSESILTVWHTFDMYLRNSIIRTYVHRVQEIIALPQKIAQRQKNEAENVARAAGLFVPGM